MSTMKHYKMEKNQSYTVIEEHIIDGQNGSAEWKSMDFKEACPRKAVRQITQHAKGSLEE